MDIQTILLIVLIALATLSIILLAITLFKRPKCFDNLSTVVDETKKQNEYLGIANEYVKNKKVDGIRISTRPDYIDKETLKRLKKYNVKTIELGVQSTNDYILKRCDRGHTFLDVKNASKLIRKYGFTLGHQIMVGLPESTKLDEIRTAKDLIKLKPKMVRIYPVLVIKGTKLERELEEDEYKPLTVSQAVERCKELLYLFNKRKIQVIRVGLQNTDEITDPNSKKSEVVAGPYHPAFGQLVEASMWYDSILNEIKKINTKVIEIKLITNALKLCFHTFRDHSTVFYLVTVT